MGGRGVRRPGRAHPARLCGRPLPSGDVRGCSGCGGGRRQRGHRSLHPPSAGGGRHQPHGPLLSGGPGGGGDHRSHRPGQRQPHQRPVCRHQDQRPLGGRHGASGAGCHEAGPGGEPQAYLPRAPRDPHHPHGHRRGDPGESGQGGGVPGEAGAGPGGRGGGEARL